MGEESPKGRRGGDNTPMSGDVNPIKPNSPRALVWTFLPYPGQPGTGQKCSNVGIACPHLDICAPKPHRRWGPRMQPQPKIKDFRPGTPALPRPLLSQCVPVSVCYLRSALVWGCGGIIPPQNIKNLSVLRNTLKTLDVMGGG